MAFNLYDSKGCSLERQRFTWRDLVQNPISKLDDDAFTRVRVILMNAIEHGAIRFQHMAARMNGELRLALAQVGRAEQHQATLINWLLGSDHSLLETTIAYEQLAIEMTAAVAQREPDAYLAQVYRFGLLDDLDHLYRFSALLDRLEGKDANNILQSYTDILPGRPTMLGHRAPQDALRDPYNRATALPPSKFHALTLGAVKYQTRDYYMNVGPLFSDPVARQLYAEIASVEEQHATQYASMFDPGESWLEQWLLHEANEVYHYYSCVQQEGNHHVKGIWERCLDYELGHFHLVSDLFKQYEQRDPAAVLPPSLPEPMVFQSHREFVRQVLTHEVDLRANGARFVDKQNESMQSRLYREQMNRAGSPSESVAAGYAWVPGTELNRTVIAID
ncbi:rubrerythrin [Oxalobacteraceae bacterium GrIS 1.11]